MLIVFIVLVFIALLVVYLLFKGQLKIEIKPSVRDYVKLNDSVVKFSVAIFKPLRFSSCCYYFEHTGGVTSLYIEEGSAPSESRKLQNTEMTGTFSFNSAVGDKVDSFTLIVKQGKNEARKSFTFTVLSPRAILEFKTDLYEKHMGKPCFVANAIHTINLLVSIPNYKPESNQSGELVYKLNLDNYHCGNFSLSNDTQLTTLQQNWRISPDNKSIIIPLFLDLNNFNEYLRIPHAGQLKKVKVTISFWNREIVSSILEYYVIPSFSEDWIAIDPGTTGSCIYGKKDKGTNTFGFFGNRSTIMPSVVYYAADGSILFGDAALPFENAKGRFFKTPKKLIGLNFERKLLQTNKSELVITSDRINRDLISHLIHTFVTQNPGYTAHQIMLGVPNTFSVKQTNQFLKCIPEKISVNRTEYNIQNQKELSETNAVVVYLLKSSVIAEKILNKNLIIIDIGGGTTNLSILKVSKENNSFNIKTLSKIGFYLGGEYITMLIAILLWRKWNKDPEINSDLSDAFSSKSKYTREAANKTGVPDKYSLYKIAEKVKISLNNHNNEIREELPCEINKVSYYISEKTPDNLDPDVIYLTWPEIENFIMNTYFDIKLEPKVTNSVRGVFLHLLKMAIQDAGIEIPDFVFLSGRGACLNFLSRFIKRRLQKSEFLYCESSLINDLKSCVVEGTYTYAKERKLKYLFSRASVPYNFYVLDRPEDTPKRIISSGTIYEDGFIANQIKLETTNFETLKLIYCFGEYSTENFTVSELGTIPLQNLNVPITICLKVSENLEVIVRVTDRNGVEKKIDYPENIQKEKGPNDPEFLSTLWYND